MPGISPYLDRLVPDESGDQDLRRHLARDARTRLRKTLGSWALLLGRARSPNSKLARSRVRSVVRFTSSVLRDARTSDRDRWLSSPELRSWIASVEDALLVGNAAHRAWRAELRRGRTSSSRSHLVDAVVELGELSSIAPSGSLPADFPLRALRLAMRHLDRGAREFPLLVLPFLPPAARRGRFSVPFVESPGQGRSRWELHIPAAGLKFERRGRRPARLPFILGRRSLRVGGLCLPYPAVEMGLPVSGPLVGATVASGPRRMIVGRRDGTFAKRVARAFGLMGDTWPEAASMVAARTRLVVPLREPGTVSFSSARWPGVSYINVRSAPLVRLAEDLLHEATHQRLHEIESVLSLVAGTGVPEESMEPRYYSPWRREWRPLRGLLHGGATFTVGARFFEELLRASQGARRRIRLPASRRRWLARRLLEEMENVRVALRSLQKASREGHLSPAGAKLVRTIAKERRELLVAARRRRGELARSVEGRRELARLAAHVRRVAEERTRWNWD